MISRETIDQIFQAVQVEDIVGEYVDLRKRGVNMLGLCPFHDEKTPSFTVSPTKNIYKCFGCGKGGNAIDFLMEHEGMTYPEALRYLAARYNIEIQEKELTVEEQLELTKRESFYIINTFARDFYVEQLWDSQMGRSIALSYLRERDIKDETAQLFELGYAPSGHPSMVDTALQQNYKKSYLQELGMLNKKGGDFLFNRLIFPIHNLSGKVIAFAGRQFGKTDKGPKYLNSPESDIYHKSRVLYGLHLTKKYIRQQDECLLTEGYMDVIGLYQAGIRNAVAASGTSFTKEQAKLIKRFSTNVCILFDGDAAGISAAIRGVGILLEEGLDLKVVILPEGEDPDSYVKNHGSEAFIDYKQAHEKDFILFLTEFYLGDAQNDPVAKANAIKQVVEQIGKIGDSIKRNIYVRECATRMEIEERLLIDELNRVLNDRIKRKRSDKLREIQADHKAQQELHAKSNKRQHAQPNSSATRERVANHYHQERDLLRVMLQYGHEPSDQEGFETVLDFILGNISDTIPYWESIELRPLLEQVQECYQKGNIHKEDFYLQHEDETIQKLAIELLFSPFEYSKNWLDKWDMPLQNQRSPDKNFNKDAYQALLRFNLVKVNRVIKDLTQELETDQHNKDLDEEYLIVELRTIMELQNRRNAIEKALNTVLDGSSPSAKFI